MISTNLRTKTLCTKTMSAIAGLEDNNVLVFTEFLRGIHQSIPEGLGRKIVFTPKENGLLAIEIAGTNKPLFYVHESIKEETFVFGAIKVCASDVVFQVTRATNCAIKQQESGVLLQNVVNLFDHYLLNHPFPWRICADGENILCANNKVVVKTTNTKIMQIMVAISLSGIPEKKILSTICY